MFPTRAHRGLSRLSGLWTTSEDMAVFMLAHLPNGEHAGTRILEPASVDAIHRTQFPPPPRRGWFGCGFFGDRHGAVQHGGGWVGTGAHVYLQPDLGIGMFTAFNHDDGPLLGRGCTRTSPGSSCQMDTRR